MSAGGGGAAEGRWRRKNAERGGGGRGEAGVWSGVEVCAVCGVRRIRWSVWKKRGRKKLLIGSKRAVSIRAKGCRSVGRKVWDATFGGTTIALFANAIA